MRGFSAFGGFNDEGGLLDPHDADKRLAVSGINPCRAGQGGNHQRQNQRRPPREQPASASVRAVESQREDVHIHTEVPRMIHNVERARLANLESGHPLR